MGNIFRFLLGVVLMLVVSALIAFNALLLWVASGPRSLDVVTPYIEEALSSSDQSYHVKIGETRLIWDGWKHPVDIRLQNVSVITKEGKTFTVFPEIALGVDVLYLPLGHIMPTTLTVNSPFMNLIQNDDRSLGFGFKAAGNVSADEAEPVVPFSVLLAPFISQGADNNFRNLHTIIINNAVLNMRNSKQAAFSDARDLSVIIKRSKDNVINISSSANLNYKGHSSALIGEFSLIPNQKLISGLVEFREVQPDILASLFTDNKDMQAASLPLSGRISFSMDTNANIESLEFALNGGKGIISSDKLAFPLPVNSLEITGALGNSFSEIRIDSLNADIEGAELSGSGSARIFDELAEPGASPEINAQLTLKNVPSDKIKNLWPPALSPMTREWVTENITAGNIAQTNLTAVIKKGDLKQKVLPKESIDASIDVQGLTVRYLPDHPPVHNLNGRIHVDGVALSANIESADFLEKTKLSHGLVTIDDLNVDNPYITVNLHAEAPAKDMVHFLGLPRLKHAEHLNLQENAVSGTVKGEATVGFNFFAPQGMKAEDVITYDVKADVNGITQKDFLHKFDVEGASGNIHVNNESVTFTGTAEVNGAKMSKGEFKYLFKPEKGFDTFMDITASVAVENLKRFGYPDFPFLKGNLEAAAKVKLGDKIQQTEATLNLTAADIDFQKISWKKPLEEAVKLEFVSEQKDGEGVKINSFSLSGRKINARGSAVLAANMSDFTSIKLSEYQHGENDITNLDYEVTADGGMDLSVSGDSVDLSDTIERSTGGLSFQNFPYRKVKADIGRLILGSDRVLNDVKGEFNCDKNICYNASFTGKSGDEKPFSVKISGDKNRQLSVRSADAGSLLHATGVFDGMNGGTLTMNGNYENSQGGSTLKARLDISEHTIKDAPLLGKILSLASLTGFIDALQGNGIRFKSLAMPFTMRNDVVSIDKGKTYGAAIGITFDGTITFPEKRLDIQGTVVPSYTLNNMFGKVPVLGNILTGGEGQGVFAARYSIEGIENSAKVSVNPLSILTPGFLRGLFDIFDQKAETPRPANKTAALEIDQ